MPHEADALSQGRRRAPTWMRVALVLALLLGAGVRFTTVARPFDHRSLTSWREADYVALARSFHRETPNPLHPRIDWRGDTPGDAEMELPVLPWLGGLLFRLFGESAQLLRALSAAFGAAALLAFACLAWRRIEPGGALCATVLFAANPLLVHLGGVMQPEPLMILLMVFAIGRIWQYHDEGSRTALLGAALFIGLATLAKAPAVHLGLALAWLVLRQRGLRAVVDPLIWLAAFLALVPPLAWYAWAHRLFLETGLSLGVSNETHGLSLALLRQPLAPLMGNLTVEFKAVFARTGALLALAALLQPWRRSEPVFACYAAAIVFYGLAADTSGDPWSFYYHALSVPAACLLMGLGFEALEARRTRWARPAALGLAGLALAGSLLHAHGLARWRDDHQQWLEAMHRCAHELAPRVPPGARIVVRGGSRHDEHGHPVAWNEPMVFAWMDRRGFNYPEDDFGLETLEGLAARGGRYWFAKPPDLEDVSRMAEFEGHLTLLDRCEGYALYDLGPARP